MLVEAWRKRNEKWAAEHLTPRKYELIQRRWNRISRFGAVRFSLLAGVAFALWFELCFLGMSFLTGTIQKVAHAFGRGFILSEYVFHIFPLVLLTSILVTATYYYCMREYAKLRPGKAV